MKSVNLIAFRQFTLEDIAPFLSWLNLAPALQRTAVKMKLKPPVGSGKLTPMLKALNLLKFIQLKQECFTITASGEAFLKANPLERKIMIRGIFLAEDEVKKIMALLNASSTGRIAKYLVNECFAASDQTSTLETEILALLDWTEQCGLFGYDSKKHEIFSLEHGTPKSINPLIAA